MKKNLDPPQLFFKYILWDLYQQFWLQTTSLCKKEIW